MIRIGVVDDEENARRVVLKYLERHCENYQIIFEATDYQEAVDYTLQLKPDLLFLDVHLLDGTGIEVAQEIKDKSKAKIIFTTAYNEYAINALRLRAFDYLLKPLDTEEFIDSLKRVVVEIMKEKSQIPITTTIAITTLSGTQLIEKNTILYVKAEASYCNIQMANGKTITVSKPLKYIEQQVENCPSFTKIHKSFIVNRDFVKSLDRTTHEVILKNEEKLPISRSNIKSVFEAFTPKKS